MPIITSPGAGSTAAHVREYSDPDRQAYIQAALARGLSQDKINRFIAENPGDYHRLKDVQPDMPQAQTAPTGTPAPSPTVGAGADAELGGMALSGLKAQQVTPSPMGGQTPMTVGGVPEPEPITADFAGQLPLRANLGVRMYPQESYILAGLRRAY